MAGIVIMTPPFDGKWLFIGAPYNNDEGQDTVQVRVYEQAYYPVYRTISNCDSDGCCETAKNEVCAKSLKGGRSGFMIASNKSLCFVSHSYVPSGKEDPLC